MTKSWYLIKFLLPIILGNMAITSIPAVADAIYKCPGNDGRTEFRDYPCDNGEGAPMDLLYGQSAPTKIRPSSNTKTNIAPENKQTTTKKTPPKKTNERESKAGERRFIREGMTKAEVRAKIGAPDVQAPGECAKRFTVSKNQIKATKSNCENCWDYPPAAMDPQTRTRICFIDNQVSSVHRLVER